MDNEKIPSGKLLFNFSFESKRLAKQFVKDLERLIQVRDMAARWGLGADALKDVEVKNHYGYFTYLDIVLMFGREPVELYKIDPRKLMVFWTSKQYEAVSIEKRNNNNSSTEYVVKLPEPANLVIDFEPIHNYNSKTDDAKVEAEITKKIIRENAFYDSLNKMDPDAEESVND